MRNLNNIDIKCLRVFLAVADSGGFTAAENRLNMTVSSISKHVSDLEARLGVTVCKRGRGGFELTHEGEKLYQSASSLFLAINTCTADFANLRNVVQHSLKIGLVDSIALDPSNPLPASLELLLKDYPNIALDLKVMRTNDIVQAVLNGDLDLGITLMPRKITGLNLHQLYVERIRPYISSNHRHRFPNGTLRLDDIANAPIASYVFREAIPALRDQSNVRFSAALDVIAILALGGGYIGMLPTFYSKHWVEQDMLTELDIAELQYDSPIYAISKVEGRNNPMVEVIHQIFRDLHSEN